MLDLSPDELAEVRKISKAVFGQEQRLPLMLAIARYREPFTLTDLVQDLELVHASTLQAPLAVLSENGEIRRLEPTGGSRFRYYARDESSLAWEYAEQLRDRARRNVEARLPIASHPVGASVTKLPSRRKHS